MKAQDLVIQGIETLSAMFSHISFKYGFDSTSNQHIIEIQPVSAYQTDDYIEAESGVILNFIRQFPDEGILFISNNTYIQVTDPIYIKYASISTKIGDVTIDMISQLIPNTIRISAETIFSHIQSTESAIEQGKGITVVISPTIPNKNAGEYGYAMAA